MEDDDDEVVFELPKESMIHMKVLVFHIRSAGDTIDLEEDDFDIIQ
jgi:hypothetical protein